MTIDWWTLAFQTVNVVVLIGLLGRFFWRPIAAMIEQRRGAAQHMLDEATAKRAEATAAAAEIDRTRAGFARERDAILAEAQKTAERAHAARLAAAETEAAALVAAAQATIASDKAAVDKAWAERASRLGVDIAQRLVARLDDRLVRAAFLDGLLKEIRTLPEPERQAVAANGVALEAVSATALDADDQARCQTLIGEAFGAHPQIAFKTDPALIAGLELHGPHFAVSNSWRADLTKILAELGHDGRR